MSEISTNIQKSKLWFFITIMSTFLCLLLLSSVTIIIDPLFHFHYPNSNYQYPFTNQRYQNDGITRHWDYDTIITGTSMTENFKTSECDAIFNCKSIKVPFAGGSYKEIDQNLRRAYASGKNIKKIIRSLDYSLLIKDKDFMGEGYNFPTYLTNDNIFDDVNYIFNKEILFENTYKVIEYTAEGKKTPSFDIYSNWSDAHTYGKEAFSDLTIPVKNENAEFILTEYERNMVLENIHQNVTDLADEHPETTFYLFFPPYSIFYWESLHADGTFNRRIAAEQVAIEELLKHENIKLFSFCTNYELVTNLDNYKDVAHYGEWINSDILEWMSQDEYLLSEDNYLIYLEEIKEFYKNYDYDSLHISEKAQNG